LLGWVLIGAAAVAAVAAIGMGIVLTRRSNQSP
jgi:archaellin